MAIQEDDPFLISQPLEIQSILQDLLEHRTLVRLDVPGHVTSIISTLLAWDRKAATIILDNSKEDAINTQLLRAPEVRAQCQINRIPIEFRGPLAFASFDGGSAFSMAQPRRLRRLQRRDFFRVDVPASSPMRCTLRHASLPRGKADFPLADISAGGLQLIDAETLLVEIPHGTIFEDCTLHLDAHDQVTVDLRLLHKDLVSLENGKKQCRAGFGFFQLAATLQITIQQSVGALERAAMARRWGTE